MERAVVDGKICVHEAWLHELVRADKDASKEIVKAGKKQYGKAYVSTAFAGCYVKAIEGQDGEQRASLAMTINYRYCFVGLVTKLNEVTDWKEWKVAL